MLFWYLRADRLLAGLDQRCVQDRCHSLTVIGHSAGVAVLYGHQVLREQSQPELEASIEEHRGCEISLSLFAF